MHSRRPPSQLPWPAKRRRAEVAEPAGTCRSAAGDRRVDGDRLAVERPALDHAGELVAEHERAVSGVADAAFSEPVQVRAADPDRLDTDQASRRAGAGTGSSCDADVADPVQARGRAARSRDELAPRRLLAAGAVGA